MLRTARLGGLAALIAIAALAVAAPSQAKTVSSANVTVPQAVERSCFARNVGTAPGVSSRAVTAPSYGLIKVRLSASSGNWDLGVFDARTGRSVAASAHFAARELAEGPVQKNQRLIVQACRIAGGAERAQLRVEFMALKKNPYKTQLARVSTPTREARNKLRALGLDVLEHAGRDVAAVMLHSPREAAKLGKAGFISIAEIEDYAAYIRAQNADTPEFGITSLPSGRTGPYRTLSEYNQEMTDLAANHPSIAKKINLTPLPAQRTLEGRDIEGLEISTDVIARDGKPVFLMFGLHHAREWPSGEHTIEWAYELICGADPDTPPHAANDRCPNVAAGTLPSVDALALVQTTRTVILPVSNPDGFNISRTIGGFDGANGRGGDETVNILTHPNEYRRKNCRVAPPDPTAGPATGNCAAPAYGLGAVGVDLNRNYGTFWGGPGSSHSPDNETYHGPHCATEAPSGGAVKGTDCGPFSERETEAIRRFVSGRQVTTLITNHTFTGLVLRAPGISSQGLAPDEPAMKALGDAMASKNGYTSQYGWQLYDTTGTTEDWSYNTTGGYGYTFEIGKNNFHPPYAEMIANFDGTPGSGFTMAGGNRAAYYLANQNAADPMHHSVIQGTAPPSAVLRLKKTVQTPTSVQETTFPYAYKTFPDTLETTIVVPPSGTYTWHINPSTRPLVSKTKGRAATGPPSPRVTFSGGPLCTAPSPVPPPIPPPTQCPNPIPAPLPTDPAIPCADVDTTDPNCWNDHTFAVPPQGAVDNESAVVRIEWLTPGSDWDMKVYRDSPPLGTSAGEPAGNLVGTSAQGTSSFEQVTLSQAGGTLTPGNYVIRVINYAALEPYTGNVTFYGPEPFQPAQLESWTLTCEITEGTAVATKQVTIGRGNGQPATPNPPFPAPASPQTHNFGPTCLIPTGVEVANFAARATKVGVAVTWRTANERNIAGFNVWRAGKKLNRTLIEAKRSGTVSGATYRLVDRTARTGVRYTYRLQTVTRDGSRSWLGQSTVRAQR